MPGHDRDVVVIRFGCNTPFFILSMTYGVFYDPNTRLWFLSLDHFLGYHMLQRAEHRREIINSPNGWIANQNLNRILRAEMHFPGDPVIHPEWEDGERDRVMLRGLALKYAQNTEIARLLIRTHQRPIVDESRTEDLYWCHSSGRGLNMHGQMLEDHRTQIRAGTLPEHQMQE